MSDPTFWNNNSPLQPVTNALQALVPIMGEVTDPTSPKLERFRVASNCYYDLYNNGLCNRATEFRRIFGLASSKYGSYRTGFSAELYRLTERAMEKIVIEAAAEQIAKNNAD